MKKLLVIAAMCIFPILSCSKASTPSPVTENATPTETKDATPVPASVMEENAGISQDPSVPSTGDATTLIPAQ